MKELTELTVSGNGTCILSFQDGFFCGTMGTITREKILNYIENDVYDDDNPGSKRVKFVKARWQKVLEDFEAGTLKDGHYPLFFEDNPKLEKLITKFRGDLFKLGYRLDGGFSGCIVKVENDQ